MKGKKHEDEPTGGYLMPADTLKVVTAAFLAQRVGLKGLQQVVDATGTPLRTLHSWAKSRPDLLRAVIYGVAAQAGVLRQSPEELLADAVAAAAARKRQEAEDRKENERWHKASKALRKRQ